MGRVQQVAGTVVPWGSGLATLMVIPRHKPKRDLEVVDVGSRPGGISWSSVRGAAGRDLLVEREAPTMLEQEMSPVRV